MLPSRETAMTGKHHAQGLIAFAKTAEEAGFDSVWVGDSLLTRTGAEPLSMRIGSLTARPESVAEQLLPALKEIGSP
jgi:alkanesulfonate monooxygenase SsuD/methylene tetrahydromethanopterin reductase-like flavin-dependent oxidoreductase (luciferase family)